MNVKTLIESLSKLNGNAEVYSQAGGDVGYAVLGYKQAVDGSRVFLATAEKDRPYPPFPAIGDSDIDMEKFNASVAKVFESPNGGAMLFCLEPGLYIAAVNVGGKVTIQMQTENELLVALGDDQSRSTWFDDDGNPLPKAE